jgi:HK97 family phage major capsid protein
VANLLDQLRDQRAAVRTDQDGILTRAAEEQRDLTPEELADHTARSIEARELDDRIEQVLADQVAELRAAGTRQTTPAVPHEPVLTREQSVYDWCQARGHFDPADQQLSFDRYLRGLVTGRWEGAEHERALSEGTLTAGGHLVPTPLSARVIDLARNATRVFQAGAITVPMTAATLKLARLTGENAPAWKSENASITDQDMTFDSVTFTARTMVRLIKLSLELFEDSDPSAEDVIARSFAGQVALELDRVALRGSGTPPEPQGIRNQTGVTITTHGANGALIATATAYDWHLDARGVVAGNNFDPNAHIQAPRTSTSLSKLREATTSAYLAPPPNMLPMLTTKQVPINLTVGTSTDTSEIYTADWSQLMIGIRNDFRLIPLKERYLADNLQVAFLAYLRADVQLAQPSAFVVDTGIRT